MESISHGISVGSWIRIVEHRLLRGYVGFVLKQDKDDERFRVLITRDSKGDKTHGALWVHEDQVVPYRTSRDEDDLLLLIDMALDMKDENWFKELTDKLPLANF